MTTNETTQTKTCPKCGRTLTAEHFYVSNRSNDGLQCYCKDCTRQTNAQCYRRSKQANTPQIVKSCTHALAEFTPRQLIEELRARGYKGELQYVNIIKL